MSFSAFRRAERCGLEVPRYRLAEDGISFGRRSLRPAPGWHVPRIRGFLRPQCPRTEEKYRGSYETSIVKRFTQFANSPQIGEDLERLFTLIVLNCALRNGDAHLKNFGILYDDVQGNARLAPVYDVVTTSVYLPSDSMALTMNGSTRWPTAKELRKLGETRGGSTPAKTRQILERIAEAIQETTREVHSYMKEHPEFAEIGQRMLEVWENGVNTSLRG
jgi:serine/threonine-protein kinase HipA